MIKVGNLEFGEWKYFEQSNQRWWARIINNCKINGIYIDLGEVVCIVSLVGYNMKDIKELYFNNYSESYHINKIDSIKNTIDEFLIKLSKLESFS